MLSCAVKWLHSLTHLLPLTELQLADYDSACSQKLSPHDVLQQGCQRGTGLLLAFYIKQHQSQLHVQVTLGQFDKAATLFEEALQANPDDWASLQQYLDCLMPSTACPRSAVGKHLAQAKFVQSNASVKVEDLDQLAVLRVGCCLLFVSAVVTK